MSYLRFYILLFVLILWMVIPLTGFNDQQIDNIRFRMEKRSLYKGRVTVTVADIYFQSKNGRIIKNYIKPEGKVAITGKKGEMALYDKKNNRVVFDQNPDYNTEDNILFFILSEKISTEGINEMGFQLESKLSDENRSVTKWIPPPFMNHLFKYVKITSKDNKPVLASYYDKEERLLVKTYFTDYESFPELTLPLTLTEFMYVNENDSIINRVNFSEVKINEPSKNDFFDFEIPDDAKIVK